MYKKLRAARIEMSVSVNILAKLLGLKTNAAYYKKENGKVKFTIDESILIADYFKESVEYLFEK